MADLLFVPDEGLKQKLETLRDQLLTTLTIHLYQNNHTPAAGDTVAAYTECTFSGYFQQSLNGWGAVTVVGGVAACTHITKTWDHNGAAVGNLVYGWYATSPAGKVIAASLRAAGPITLNGVGQSYSVDLTMTDERA